MSLDAGTGSDRLGAMPQATRRSLVGRAPVPLLPWDRAICVAGARQQYDGHASPGSNEAEPGCSPKQCTGPPTVATVREAKEYPAKLRQTAVTASTTAVAGG